MDFAERGEPYPEVDQARMRRLVGSRSRVLAGTAPCGNAFHAGCVGVLRPATHSVVRLNPNGGTRRALVSQHGQQLGAGLERAFVQIGMPTAVFLVLEASALFPKRARQAPQSQVQVVFVAQAAL